MEKEFIPYEQALALKELGFDEECFWWYDFLKETRKDKHGTNNNSKYFKNGNSCSAPLYQQAFRWFREKYNLFTSFHCPEYDILTYDYRIYKIGDSEIFSKEFKNFEESELYCLKKLIEILKNK